MNETREAAPLADAAGAEKPKSRVVAALIGLLAPGFGQVFVGRTWRGVAWAAVPFVVFTLFMIIANEPSLMKVFTVLGVSVLFAYAGAMVDVLLMPVRNHRPTSIPAVIGFAVAPILIAPAFAVAMRMFVVEAFKVPSAAMTPSISVNDHLFVDKSVYRGRAPKRGEVVVYEYPENPTQDFIHRAIAVSGDKLELRGGHPFINDWEVPSCPVSKYQYEDSEGLRHRGDLFVEFLESSAYLIFLEKSAFADHQGPFLAAPGETWMLGDNRNNSHDSRMWSGGIGRGVPRANVKGRGRLIWFSPGGLHRGVDLAGDPVAPSPELAAPLAACLANRPPIAKTTPPAAP